MGKYNLVHKRFYAFTNKSKLIILTSRCDLF